ncbi:MAG: lysozyme [Rhodospirillaceae bacterium]|nr:MAG: lysozyme [Rhodospirillaceae bacterium]
MASPRALSLIREFENFKPWPYLDVANHLTVGFGHLLHEGELAEIPLPLQPELGEKLLDEDVRHTEAAIKRLVRVPLSYNQYDALVSFIFNVGTSALTLGFGEALNAGRYEQAAEKMLLYTKIHLRGQVVDSEGLINRRKKEHDLFVA